MAGHVDDKHHITNTPGRYNTVPRPGQSGAQDERRAGPNPRSQHPTGPHAPYEPDDLDGTAAVKHDTAGQPAPAEPLPKKKGLLSENFVIMSGGRAIPADEADRDRGPDADKAK